MLPAPLLALPAFTFAQARELGVGPGNLRSAVRSGEVERVARGWYTRSGTTTPEQAHAIRARVAHERTGHPLSHVSALVHHGLPVYDPEPRPVYLSAPTRERRSRTAVVVAAALPGGSVVGPDGVAVTPGEALLTTALVDPELALAAADAADAAVRRDLVQVESLRADLPRLHGRPGGRAARVALSIVDPRRESVGESRVAWLAHAWGLELEPQLAIDLGGRSVYPDFRIKGTRVLLEFDGLAKYTDRSVLVREKLREDELRRLGWVVVRITWGDLYRPAVLHRRILAALAR